MDREKPSLSYLRTWGCLAKVNIPINKKHKLGPKTVNCVFLGYAQRSIVYRFLVVKSEIHGVHVDSIMESRDAIFFENIFPKFLMNSMRNMVLFMRGRLPTHLSQTGLLRERTTC